MRVLQRLKQAVAVFGLGAMVAGGALADTPQAKLSDGSSLSGLLVDVGDTSLSAFLGIPYAEPPVGDLRWQAPVPAAAAAREAKQFGPACPQQGKWKPKAGGGGNTIVGNEDCLYLNVWSANQKPTKAMPVMVWIHGGGFVRGATSDPRFNGSWLASQGIVVVTISYRLGVMSAPPPLPAFLEGGSQSDAVNFGLMDQTLALQWVQSNIAAFGGDPAQVTIAGSSAGGASVGYLTGNPAVTNQRLFAKAIMMSSGGGDRKPAYNVSKGQLPKQYEKLWKAFADGLDGTQKCGLSRDQPIGRDMTLASAQKKFGLAKAIRHCVPAEQIAAAFGSKRNAAGKLLVQEYRAYPFFDGQTVSSPSQVDGFKSDGTAGIPLIAGFASDEATVADSLGQTLRKRPLLRRLKSAGAGSVKSWRDVTALYQDPEGKIDISRRLYADLVFHWPAQIIACLQSHNEKNVYVYQFDYASAERERDPESGAGHSEDAVWLFGRPLLASVLGNRSAPVSERDNAFISAFAGAILNFVKTGNPNGGDGAHQEWPPYMPGMQAMKISGPTFDLQSGFDGKRLAAIQAMARKYGVDFSLKGCSH